MDFADAEQIVESVRKKPIKTIVIVIVLIVFGAIMSYVCFFSGEKAKQHADLSKEGQETVSASRDNHQPKATSKIEQQTKGKQSPAIVSEGDVNINFGKDK